VLIIATNPIFLHVLPSFATVVFGASQELVCDIIGPVIAWAGIPGKAGEDHAATPR
jgi:hypothetical protein